MVFNSNGNNRLNMKKITLLLLLTLSVLGLQAQTYQLNYGPIRYGYLNGTTVHSIYGQVDLKNVGLGLVSDSILTVLNGRIRKVPYVAPATGTVTNVSALTLGTSGTDLNSTVANSTTTPVITLNVPNASASARGVITTGSQTLAGLKSFNTNIELGTTGTAGKLSLKRSSDGAIASTVEQVDGNKLTLTSSGGTKLFDINADRIDFNSTAATATYWFGQNRPTATEVLINGSNNNKLILQNNEVAQLTLNSNGGTITSASLGSSGDIIVGANNTGLAGKITVGSGLSLTAGVLTATGGASGTVTTAGGTAGKIAKFTSSSNIENSIMTEAGSVISIAGDAETSGTNGFSGKSLLIGTDGTIANYRWQTSLSGNDEIFASRSFGTVRTTNYSTGATVYSGAISATNLSGTNTGDQTSVTGNAGTATALQTARNIQGVSFNGTADINPINGTGFVKATGTTLSYDNSTYLTGNQSITLSGAVTGTGTTGITTTLASGIDATKIADGSVTSTEFQYINTLSSNAQTQLNSKAPVASPTFTGTVSGITAAMVGAPSGSGTSTGTNTGDQDLAPYATLASPALTGSPTAPTQTAGDNSTKIATTAYVDGSISSVASSNTYTPTPSAGSNSVTITPRVHMYTIVGKIVTVYGAAVIDYTSDNTTTIFSITLPAGVGGGGFPNIYSATGSGVSIHTSNVERTVLIDAISSTSSVTISSTSPVTVGKQYEVKYSFMYKIN